MKLPGGKSPHCALKGAFVLLMLFGLLLSVNGLFSCSAPCVLLEARYSADTLLSYLGMALVGIGTIVMSYFAYKQTGAIEEVKREMEIAQRRFERENTGRPFLVMSRVLLDGDEGVFKVDKKGVRCTKLPESCAGMQVEVKNVGSGPACKVRMCDDSAFGTALAMDQHRICLPRDAAYVIEFSLGAIRKHGSDSVEIELKYENILGCEFKQTFVIGYREEMVSSGDREFEIIDGSVVDVSGYELEESLSVSALSSQICSGSANTMQS